MNRKTRSSITRARVPRSVQTKGDRLYLCFGASQWAKDQTKVEYAIGGLDQQLFVSLYLVALPKPNEIERLVERDRALWERRGETTRSDPALCQR
jgi:hypothetical protein